MRRIKPGEAVLFELAQQAGVIDVDEWSRTVPLRAIRDWCDYWHHQRLRGSLTDANQAADFAKSLMGKR